MDYRSPTQGDMHSEPGRPTAVGVQQQSQAIEMMARETGLEPAASAVTGRRSNQLSYSRTYRNRTLLRAGPEGLKARSPLVKVVTNMPISQGFLSTRCKK
jgi:hypothetical protein